MGGLIGPNLIRVKEENSEPYFTNAIVIPLPK